MKRVSCYCTDVMIEVTKQVRNELHSPIQPRTHAIARLGVIVHVMDTVGEVLVDIMRHKYAKA
jgi:hypothetical protein